MNYRFDRRSSSPSRSNRPGRRKSGNDSNRSLRREDLKNENGSYRSKSNRREGNQDRVEIIRKGGNRRAQVEKGQRYGNENEESIEKLKLILDFKKTFSFF